MTRHPGVVAVARRVQTALFAAEPGEPSGVSDLQIAATAVHHSSPMRPVIVAHYDIDFDHVAAVEPAFRSQWIVPRGTADWVASTPN